MSEGRRTPGSVPARPLRAMRKVLPGMAGLSARPVWGLTLLGAWLGLITLALVRWPRIAVTLRGGAVDEWVALLSLVAVLALVWRAGQWTPEPEGPASGPTSTAASEPSAAGASGWVVVWRSFRRHRAASVGLCLVAILVLAALLTPYLAPHDPAAQGADIVATRFQPPSWAHPLGTDRFGRDVFSRVLYGSRISLGIGFVAVLIAISIGTLIGALAGYLRGWTDTLAMRVVDLLLSFPRLVLLVTVAALFGPSILLITMVLGLTGWMGTSRIIRGEVLSAREREYVQAARALGFRNRRILFRHILPNVLSPVIVAATLGIGNTILAETALAFLGLGVPPPIATWGSMVASGRDVMLDAWWITTFPGLAIVVTVMSFNLVGDGLRDALDPRALNRDGI